MSYSIVTGWYADHQARGYRVHGSDFVRSVECFDIWYHCVRSFTSPSNILIIDSASPLRPSAPDDPRISWVKLKQNYGHAVEGKSTLCGWSRALLLGLSYGFNNGDLYTVLVEQGTLFYGKDIIERQIAVHPDADIIAPSGFGTPQPLQTGILIFRSAIIPKFVENYVRIAGADDALSPEKKVALAGNDMKIAFSALPYGRRRPIDVSADHFFLRHCDLPELHAFTTRLGFGNDLLPRPEHQVA
ncbi:hypothetical protein HGP17_23215 [Rhizobium sp. P38BS-XIX]|uniref:hypothetical protein n=1 Tax=Rhizobium sp. P38BS-XIX TaxID=2726740 RepID=UPI0014573503|nr:hypothetical protein [Rhizobium sp. P38BS-XIX]NLR99741.1 hypothetical protein [Rhizobium sp. P38BS-XIX]